MSIIYCRSSTLKQNQGNHMSIETQLFYCKNDYHNSDICLFFGMYSGKDINILRRHRGYKFLIWGGTDCNWNYPIRVKNIEVIKKIPDLYHIAISEKVTAYLKVEKDLDSIHLQVYLETDNSQNAISIESQGDHNKYILF